MVNFSLSKIVFIDQLIIYKLGQLIWQYLTLKLPVWEKDEFNAAANRLGTAETLALSFSLSEYTIF